MDDAQPHLRQLFDQQRAAFARGAPDYTRRMQALQTLRDGVRSRQEELLQAVSDDFGGRAHEETLLLELFPLYDQIRHARRHLKAWMKRRRVGSSWFLQPSRAFYQYQPLGVAGIIGAWNYQLLLTLGPLVDAIAAGNHVILKPSEITPRSAAVIAAIIVERFPPDYVACITGGTDVAGAFTALPFDHLFFTGSTRVGKLVMQAAAENLTPVTLELGGKSPAIIHESYPMAQAAERIMSGKLINAGQTCVAPDYVLVPAGREQEFEREARRIAATLYPQYAGNGDYTRIVGERHYQRLQSLLDEAATQGARIVPLGAQERSASPADKLIVPTLIFNAGEGTMLMREEIFGPLLPVVAYASLDEALAYVNARPRPLALYYFDQDRRRVDHVLANTLSGGVTVNDCLLHLGQHNLPFGGVGPSGMGHYHGFDGFQTFSKKRGVMVQSRFAGNAMLRPPYGKRKRGLIAALLRLALR
ncbi:coniferyl-aldehyde dehydrogenase [Noviherbaspirillum humi]|uniref:Aldehyde dehydrogenase n=1 Tax=Noviherbaspirillum humi TaxID=1688639 RepID=A0A239HVQ5_9BURK|nr:coniferyl aldehyde dehydrogenase [Noviherbaspirillum humi]SNS84254.1 coniferyl-aldehyde dehydrogenase [Noviherbaspirillum humi]